MEGWLKISNCQSLGELARRIIYKEEIVWYHKDDSTSDLMVEMTAIRKELNSIGTNINQVTRFFNGTSIPNQKIFEALKILDEYKKVSDKVTSLQNIMNSIEAKWSQK
jgi:hypothetical protein